MDPASRSRFGEFLVEHQILDRYQLFRALQLQDRAPNARLGHCAVALGYAVLPAIEQLHRRFAEAAREAADAELDAMATAMFQRDAEIEITFADAE